MTWYNVGLLVHILRVLGIFIATGVEHLVLWRLRAARTTQIVREWSLVMGWAAKLFAGSGTLILGAGLYMTITSRDWGQAWIDAALGLLVIASISGARGT